MKLLLLVALLQTEAGARLPTITHYDTRALTWISFAPEVAESLIVAQNRARETRLEEAFCLFGSVQQDTLAVLRAAPPAFTDRDSISFNFDEKAGPLGCPQRDFVGGFHTHLSDGQPRESPRDYRVFAATPEALLLVVGLDATPATGVAYWMTRNSWGYVRLVRP